MTASLWIVAAVTLIVIEIVTPGAFFFACLGIGALAAGALSLLTVIAWPPWAAFVVVSVASIYFIRPVARRLFHSKGIKSNVDALLGQKAWVTEDIMPPQLGTVKVEGELWRAEAAEPISKESWVVVTTVKGTRLEVRK